MPASLRRGVVSASCENCCLAPYVMGMCLCGECWGFLRHGVIVFNEEFTYVVFHRELTFTFGVIPVKVDTSKFSAIPIDSDVVVFVEGVGEVVCMFVSNILNTEIVND